MIASNISEFLGELGLSEIQIKIYTYLLTHKFGNINEIKKALNCSYTQVHHNLIILEEKGLIESSDSKPRKITALGFLPCRDRLLLPF